MSLMQSVALHALLASHTLPGTRSTMMISDSVEAQFKQLLCKIGKVWSRFDTVQCLTKTKPAPNWHTVQYLYVRPILSELLR